MTMGSILYKLPIVAMGDCKGIPYVFDLFPNSFPNSCAYIYRNHWALSVVNTETQIVYHKDPLKRQIADEEWIKVVDKLVQ